MKDMTKNCLVLEDNNELRDVLCELLRIMGVETFAAASTEQASQYIETKPPSHALLDWNLNAETSISVIEQLSQTQANTRIAVMTGDPGQLPQQWPVEVTIFSKPMTMQVLKAWLESPATPSQQP